LRATNSPIRGGEPYELHWRGNWAHQSVFASERRFRIESLPDDRVRFHQSERFDGIAATLLWRGLQLEVIDADRHEVDKLHSAGEKAANSSLAHGSACVC